MINFDFIVERSEFPNASEINFDFGAASFNILAGNSNIITAIWADPDAGRSDGKVYIASYGDGTALSVLDLNLKRIYDRYTLTAKGRANQTLNHNDPKDVII